MSVLERTNRGVLKWYGHLVRMDGERLGKREEDVNALEIKVGEEVLDEVDKFRYLGMDVSAQGRMEEEVSHRVEEGAKVLGAMRKMWDGKVHAIQNGPS